MSTTEVHIVELEPLRVASVRAFGPAPEEEAWAKLSAWMRVQGLTEDLVGRRIFGFNNPDPSHGSPNYGYEFWVTVDALTQPEQGVEIKDFPGGKFAVAHCEVQDRPYETIPAAWHALLLWVENSPYKQRGAQCLEERISKDQRLDGDWDLDLHLPIEA